MERMENGDHPVISVLAYSLTVIAIIFVMACLSGAVP